MKTKSAPPVWMMVKQALSALGGRTTRKAILHWVQTKYPGTKANTIGCQTTICTVNNPVRIQFAQNARPREKLNQYDFLYQSRDNQIVEYSPRKHGLWVIRRNRGGALTISLVAKRSAIEPRDSQLHILICGAPSQNKDYAYLTNMAINGGADRWSGMKGARRGDQVLFYTVQERRAFMASGWVLADAEPTNDPSDYPYRVKVGAIRLLDAPVSIEIVRKRFPAWGWPRYRRNYTTVPKTVAVPLWTLIHESSGTQPAPEPPAANNRLATTPTKRGSGFGDPKTNRLVEQAAIAKATKRLRELGFTVRSRERENIGYDLDAKNGHEEMHVEVKGRSGAGGTFVITQNEVATARIDPLFRLFVVSKARTKQASIVEYSGKDFVTTFALNPISYTATLK